MTGNVLIVGGGISGLTEGFALRHAGVPVTVIDEMSGSNWDGGCLQTLHHQQEDAGPDPR